MDIEITPPFVWPEPRVLAGLRTYPCEVPFDALIRQAGAIFGVVRDVTGSGVAWLKEVLCSTSTIQSRIMIALYPACATTEADLKTLEQLQDPTNLLASVEFRVLTLEDLIAAPANLLCWLTDDQTEPLIAFGPNPYFRASGYDPVQVNLVFRPDPGLWLAYRQWFDYVWANAIPLNANTACIPPLVPAIGTPEALALWDTYAARCNQTLWEKNDDNEVVVDAVTGAVQAFDANGHPLTTATEAILPATDTLAAEVSQLYSRGALVTVDKTTRLKPFATPVDPRWFGIATLG